MPPLFSNLLPNLLAKAIYANFLTHERRSRSTVCISYKLFYFEKVNGSCKCLYDPSAANKVAQVKFTFDVLEISSKAKQRQLVSECSYPNPPPPIIRDGLEGADKVHLALMLWRSKKSWKYQGALGGTRDRTNRGWLSTITDNSQHIDHQWKLKKCLSKEGGQCSNAYSGPHGKTPLKKY